MTTLVSPAVDALLNLKGQFLTLTIERDAKVRKGCAPVMKRSVVTVRVGVEYDNLKAVASKRVTGDLPDDNAGLPWGVWSNYPYVITHHGQDYFRFYPVAGCKPKVTWFRGDDEVSFSDIESDLLASEKSDRDRPDTFTLKVQSIKSVKVHGETYEG